MLLKMMFPSRSPLDTGVILVVGNIAFTCVDIMLQNRVLSALGGQLQGLAMQSLRADYVKLSVYAVLMRGLKTTLWQARERFHHNCGLFFRLRLTRAIHDKYFMNANFHWMCCTDKRMTSPDVVITEDVWMMGRYVAWMINALIGPVFETLTTGYLLLRAKLPVWAMLIMHGQSLLNFVLLKLWTPDYAQLNKDEQERNGQLRKLHDRLEQSAEAIAFLDGARHEEQLLNAGLEKVLEISLRLSRQKCLFEVFTGWLRDKFPSILQEVLRFAWSSAYGSDAMVLSEASGTGLSSQIVYVQDLMKKSSSTIGSLLGNAEDVQKLVGTVERMTNLLLIADEAEAARGS